MLIYLKLTNCLNRQNLQTQQDYIISSSDKLSGLKIVEIRVV